MHSEETLTHEPSLAVRAQQLDTEASKLCGDANTAYETSRTYAHQLKMNHSREILVREELQKQLQTLGDVISQHGQRTAQQKLAHRAVSLHQVSCTSAMRSVLDKLRTRLVHNSLLLPDSIHTALNTSSTSCNITTSTNTQNTQNTQNAQTTQNTQNTQNANMPRESVALFDFVDDISVDTTVGALMKQISTITELHEQCANIYEDILAQHTHVVEKFAETEGTSIDETTVSLLLQDVTRQVRKLQLMHDFAQRCKEHNNAVANSTHSNNSNNSNNSNPTNTNTNANANNLEVISLAEHEHNQAMLQSEHTAVWANELENMQSLCSSLLSHLSHTTANVAHLHTVFDLVTTLALNIKASAAVFKQNENALEQSLRWCAETLGELENLVVWYQHFEQAHDKLVEEMAKRRTFEQTITKKVAEMQQILDTAVQTEIQRRSEFDQQHACYLPEVLYDPANTTIPPRFVIVGEDSWLPLSKRHQQQQMNPSQFSNPNSQQLLSRFGLSDSHTPQPHVVGGNASSGQLSEVLAIPAAVGTTPATTSSTATNTAQMTAQQFSINTSGSNTAHAQSPPPSVPITQVFSPPSTTQGMVSSIVAPPTTKQPTAPLFPLHLPPSSHASSPSRVSPLMSTTSTSTITSATTTTTTASASVTTTAFDDRVFAPQSVLGGTFVEDSRLPSVFGVGTRSDSVRPVTPQSTGDADNGFEVVTSPSSSPHTITQIADSRTSRVSTDGGISDVSVGLSPVLSSLILHHRGSSPNTGE